MQRIDYVTKFTKILFCKLFDIEKKEDYGRGGNMI